MKREVAIKVLPDGFSSDAERVVRFQQTSLRFTGLSTLAAQCLILELVEGETLAERIRRGRIPVEDALPLAKQIAEALEAAHDKGNWRSGVIE